MKKRILISLLAIVAAAAIVIGGTTAFFSDTETSTGNTFTAGAIDLKIDSTTSYNGEPVPTATWTEKDLVPTADKFFNFSDIKPGDFGENTISLHVINNDAWVCADISNLTDLENGQTEPEALVDTTIGTNEGELSQNMDWKIWRDDGAGGGIAGDNVQNGSEETLATGHPVNGVLAVYDSTTATGPLLGDNTGYLGISWSLPSETGNEVQTDSLTGDISFYVEQARNNDNFVCSQGGIETECVPTTEICSDQIDNDCDGYIDCGDSDCANEQACQPVSNDVTIQLENKSGSWAAITGDGIYGELTYNPSAPTFDYSFVGRAQTPGNYNLIYYPDPWGDPKTVVPIGGVIITDASGNFNTGNQSVELGMDLPNSVPGFDSNYPTGAKVWLVPSAQLAGNIFDWQNLTNLLLEMDWVNYQDTDLAHTETITLADFSASSQYGYYHDYSGANVSFAYTSPNINTITGIVSATGLKPYATYQLKFDGKPTCSYGAAGDDVANEQIGYMGRWWDNTTNSNTTDAGYLANSIYYGGTHCISGYLVWGFITADASGSATEIVTTDSSYHVLWSGGGVCNTNVNTYLAHLDAANPTIWFSPADKVNGQLERGTCGGLTFASGNYKLGMILNEESFHQSPGTWTAVMGKDIEFKIN